MADKATFRCLRCGNEFQEPYDAKAPLVERSCPKCKSNSIRRMKTPPAGAKA